MSEDFSKLLETVIDKPFQEGVALSADTLRRCDEELTKQEAKLNGFRKRLWWLMHHKYGDRVRDALQDDPGARSLLLEDGNCTVTVVTPLGGLLASLSGQGKHLYGIARTQIKGGGPNKLNRDLKIA